MGLDPPTIKAISLLLHRLAEAQEPRILLSLRPQDPLPTWITHVVCLGPELRVAHQGVKWEVLSAKGVGTVARNDINAGNLGAGKLPLSSREGLPRRGESAGSEGEPIVEMRDIRVQYGHKVVLGNWQEVIDGEQRQGFNWTVRRGQRWVVCGLNGKTATLFEV